MEYEIKQAIKHRLEKKANFLQDELDTGWHNLKNIGGTIGAPVWALSRGANPLSLGNTTAQTLKYGLGGAGIGTVAGGIGGAGLTAYGTHKILSKLDIPLSAKIAIMLGAGTLGGLGGAWLGGTAGAALGAGTGAVLHNPWRTYRKNREQNF